MFYTIHNWHNTINCDNKSAIIMSKRNLRRIRPGCSCADILRNLRNTRKMMSANIKYRHVDGHMDKYLLFHQLTLEQKKNTATGMRREGNQLLSSEGATVFVNTRKLTRDAAKTVRYEVGKNKPVITSYIKRAGQANSSMRWTGTDCIGR